MKRRRKKRATKKRQQRKRMKTRRKPNEQSWEHALYTFEKEKTSVYSFLRRAVKKERALSVSFLANSFVPPFFYFIFFLFSRTFFTSGLNLPFKERKLM
jgi:hypothetical protein